MPLVITPQSSFDRTDYDYRVIALLSQQNYTRFLNNSYMGPKAKSPLHMTESELNIILENIRRNILVLTVRDSLSYIRNSMTDYFKLCFIEAHRRQIPLAQVILNFFRGEERTAEEPVYIAATRPIRRDVNQIPSYETIRSGGRVLRQASPISVSTQQVERSTPSFSDELVESLRRLQENPNAYISSAELSELIVDTPERN